jgi:hypothetical protein
MDNYSYKSNMTLSSLKLCDHTRKLNLKSAGRRDLRQEWEAIAWGLRPALLGVHGRTDGAELFDYIEGDERGD